MTSEPEHFDAIKDRLNEIADEVAQEGISLDEALALYEEAVTLGLRACDVSEEDILSSEPDSEPDDGMQSENGVRSDNETSVVEVVALSQEDESDTQVITVSEVTQAPSETE